MLGRVIVARLYPVGLHAGGCLTIPRVQEIVKPNNQNVTSRPVDSYSRYRGIETTSYATEAPALFAGR